MRRILVLTLVVLALGSGVLPGTAGIAAAAGGVPGTPGPATAVPGDASATVTWRAPLNDGGSAITGYVVTPYLGEVAQPPVTFSSPATTRLLTGLQNGGSYRFRVAAVNANGTGPMSGLPGAFSVIVVGAPAAPTNLAVVGGAGSARLTWTPPAPAPLAIVGYSILTRRPTETGLSGLTSTAPADATSAVVTLEPGPYTFTIWARTEAGPGPSAVPVAATVTPGVPQAPFNTKAIARNARATVSWSAPSPPTGAPVTGYSVTPTIDGVDRPPVTVAAPAVTVDIAGLPNGSSATFRVSATNGVGTGPDSGPSTSIVIGAPTIAGIAKGVPGDGTATVTWSPPVSANGSPITGYVLTPYLDGAALTPITFASAATTQLVTGLENGRTYGFRVAATNARGTGVASPLTNALVFTTVGAPVAPVVTATAGSRAISATWAAPASNGSPITEYAAYLVYDGSFGGEPVRTTDRTVTFSNVTAGRAARIQVVATNARGDGPPGLSGSVIATSSTPVAPSSITVQVGDGSAFVSGQPPADDGGSPVTGYLVTPIAAGVPLTPVPFGPTTTWNVTGLQNGVRHTFTVAAVNANGVGESSVPTASAIVGAPRPPSVSGVVPGDGSATVTWGGGSDNNSPITSCTVTPYLGSTALAPVTVTGPAQQATITGLQNGSTYTFRIAATNARGRGVASARGPLFPSPVGTPAPPAVTSTAIGSGQLAVSWTPGSAGPSPIVSFDLIVVPTGGSLLFAQKLLAPPGDRTAIVGSLSPGTSYTVYVVARNAFGDGPAGAALPVVVT